MNLRRKPRPMLARTLFLVPLLWAAFYTGCRAAGGANACAPDDVDCSTRAAEANPVRSTAYWKPDFGLPLEARVQSAPPELVRYLNDSNSAQGFQQRPLAAPLSADIRRDFSQAIGELPAPVKALVADRLIGIFLVSGLGSTGYTDVASASGRYLESGFIVIDTSVFTNRRANSWATWKESSPFRSGISDHLDARIEEAASDSRAHAIQYILLHELGHVVSIRRHLHPGWTEAPPADHDLAAYPFAHLSWRVSSDGQHYDTVFEPVFPLRHEVVFYKGARLDASEAARTYQQLHASGFATLYGATNIYDDFAESFVNYVHVVLLKRPFQIRIFHDGKVVEDYRACWLEPRCAGKRDLLEQLFKGAK